MTDTLFSYTQIIHLRRQSYQTKFQICRFQAGLFALRKEFWYFDGDGCVGA